MRVIGFDNDAIELLRSLKGKVFKSYMTAFVGSGLHSAYSRLRINLGRSAIELESEYKLEPLLGGQVEIAPFSCRAVRKDEEHIPGVQSDCITFLVDEKITGIEIIRDRIFIEPDKETFEIDMGLVISCEYSRITFTRSHWWTDEIYVSTNERFGNLPNIEDAAKDWTDDPDEGDRVAQVTRKIIEL